MFGKKCMNVVLIAVDPYLHAHKKTAGRSPRRRIDRFRSDQRILRIAWSDWLASDSEVIESCWRVCRASRFAPSWLVSASTRLSEPVCSVLIRLLVKSLRASTVVSFEPKPDAWVRSVVSAVWIVASVVLTL